MKIAEKSLFLTLLVLCILVIGTPSVFAKISAQANKLGYIPGEVIVVLESGSNFPTQIETSNEYKLKQKENLFGKVYKLTFNNDISMSELKEWLEEFEEIKSVEFNKVIKQQTVPSEGISNKWGLETIEAPEAWNYETGDKSVTIAVLDSGVHKDHEDLKDNITLGYDYVDGDDEPIDTTEDSHGTHVAGIIGAVGDNDKGSVGVMWNANILIVRALDGEGKSTVDKMIEAITNTADKNVDIINMSWGVMSFSAVLEEAINYAHNEGCILISAAGNNGVESPFYPASYDNVIGVAATDWSDELALFSNYSDRYDIAAPGQSIFSTIEKGYGTLDGTSMAAGFVTGVAGLILSQDPEADVKTILLETADTLDTENLPNKRVNAYKAVKKAYDGENSESDESDDNTDGPKAVASVGEEGQKNITVKVGEAVRFYSVGSTAKEGGELHYMWVFRDGTDVSYMSSPIHVFNAPGAYDSTLLVYNDSGISWDSVEVQVEGVTSEGEDFSQESNTEMKLK